MKKRITAVLLALAVLSALFTPAAAAADNASKPLAGQYISIIGDSISTYHGWSDAQPITDESCTYRYGEAYYGPAGGDFHNTDLEVTDTWWYQAATATGAEILVSNAGNSTGLLHASYPANADWEQYLQEMLAYKSRPYYLGANGKTPDIIALYIGSSDVGRVPISGFGSVSDIDFNALIQKNSDGTYNYAEPTTVAEAYCIMLHKITVTYPDAAIYCFTVVPNAGGPLSVGNQRLTAVYPFNDMIREVAAYHGATVVDIFSAFNLDPDGDGVATQEDWDTFKTYYHNDPHPNAAGFDVIAKCFADAICPQVSDDTVMVETTAGKMESVGVTTSTHTTSGVTKTICRASDYLTASGMIVDYNSTATSDENGVISAESSYTSTNSAGTYLAEGGSSVTTGLRTPPLSVAIPTLTGIVQTFTAGGNDVGYTEVTGDTRTAEDDGIYDYTETTVTGQGSLSVTASAFYTEQANTAQDHSGMQFVRNDTMPNGSNNMITGIAPVTRPQSADQVPAIAPGYEFVYLGSDQVSEFWAAYLYDSPDTVGFPDETPAYSGLDGSLYARTDHSVFIKRNLVVPKLYLPSETPEGTFPARYDSIQQFTLSNANATVLSAYCADQTTPTVTGFSYRMMNLEDAQYYSAAEAAMLRSIVNHGYWGTASGFGSLDSLIGELRATGRFTEDELSSITPGMAMIATQYAIWTHSNIMDEVTFVHAYYNAVSGAPSTPSTDAQASVIFKIYYYLTGLAPTYANPAASGARVIINEKNFLNSVSIDITEQVPEHPNNLDDNDANNVYLADISLVLAVQVDTQAGDNILIKLSHGQDEPLLGRIAGELQPGEIQLTLEGDAYCFHDIPLEEGASQITFELSGVQQLEKSAYLFQSENRGGTTSQTLVAVAEGPFPVGVSGHLDFTLDVTEETYSQTRFWRTEKTITPQPPTPPQNPEDPDDPTNPDKPDTPDDPDEPDTPTQPGSTPDNPGAGGTGSTGNGSTPNKPDTGDDSQPQLWFSLILVSPIAIVTLGVYRWKHRYIGHYTR